MLSVLYSRYEIHPVSPVAHYYSDRKSPLQSLVLRRVGRSGIQFTITAGRFNLLADERESMSTDAYHALIESLANVQLLISAGDNVWLQDIPVVPRISTNFAVLLDSPRRSRPSPHQRPVTRPPIKRSR